MRKRKGCMIFEFSIHKLNSKKMKNLLFATITIFAFIMLQSFTTPVPPVVDLNDITSSSIIWKGYKVTGSHTGTLELKSGSLTFDGDILTGGEFIIDMTSLTTTDLTGEYAAKLDGHLKSDDFFSVGKFSTASLIITDVKSSGKNSYAVTADLTIKGITKPVTFDASVYGKKATANLKIDRTLYDVKYGSGSFFEGLQDNLIYDEFDLVIDLEF